MTCYITNMNQMRKEFLFFVLLGFLLGAGLEGLL